ncbi:MAG: ATP-dependent Clp protease adaptor ClpS [Lachnospiraceae bacterium]|nr:ATP-dependent Clp protease adaptor ClpS [Lachnospiraceae bacterium]
MATKESVKERTGSKLKEPKLYQVIMLNDDFTSMEFVVSILIDIFHKDPVTAETLMLHVHKNGRAVVGKYPYDIALTKIDLAMSRARAEGYPFRLTMEEE